MNARSIIVVASLAGAFGPCAYALGIVRAPSHVTLGATLNFAVAVQLAADESLTSPCVNVEVLQGDQHIAPSALRVAIEPGVVAEERIVRITSTTAIEEPVVTITVVLGCGNRQERRFTVLADPPLVNLAAAPEALPPSASDGAAASTRSAAAAPRPETAPGAGTGTAAPARTDAAPGARNEAGAPARTDAGAAPRAAAAPRTAAARANAASAPAPRAARAASAPAPSTTVAAAAPRPGATARATAAPPPAGPRLRLDPVEPVAAARLTPTATAAADMQEAQLRVAAMAASAAVAEQAASAALANANAAAERMRAVEEGVAQLRADIERDRTELLTLRAQLKRAESTSKLAPWLGAGMAILAALALWLWLRMRRLQREQQAQWWGANKAGQPHKAEPPLNPPTLHPMTLPPHMVGAPPAGKPVALPQMPVTKAPPGRTQSPAFRDSLFTTQQEARDVSIEELIDLEQQAEFFVVLGQDDAAIDLLIGHIRATGGTSPLPYLKMLEIYRRLGDRESYERTRERFNHRFNAYAPDWDSDLQHGRSLDEYPGVIDRLQTAWPTPLDAMTELEALMFRRDGGELFELPAYREVLFLYSMARDLLDHQGGPPTAIDVLLPLSDAQSFEPTTARPHLFTSAGLAEMRRSGEPPIEVLHASSGTTQPGDDMSSVYGVVDLDPTKPVPMDETIVIRREDTPEHLNPDQRSDFADLPAPPDKPKK